MAGTEVLTTRMTEVAKQIEEILGKYSNSVSKLQSIGGELDSMWDGEASEKFLKILDADRDQFVELNKLLTAYVDTLRQDANIYDKAERDVIDVLNNNKFR